MLMAEILMAQAQKVSEEYLLLHPPEVLSAPSPSPLPVAPTCPKLGQTSVIHEPTWLFLILYPAFLTSLSVFPAECPSINHPQEIPVINIINK